MFNFFKRFRVIISELPDEYVPDFILLLVLCASLSVVLIVVFCFFVLSFY